MIARDTVIAKLALHLDVSDGAPLPVSTRFCYEPHDPYAVHIAFSTGDDRVVEWAFARQLLSDGVTQHVGDGDVHVWPSGHGESRSVCLSVSGPSGTALFEIPIDGLLDFLIGTYEAVPAGAEADYFDLDTEIAAVDWTAPPR